MKLGLSDEGGLEVAESLLQLLEARTFSKYNIVHQSAIIVKGNHLLNKRKQREALDLTQDLLEAVKKIS